MLYVSLNSMDPAQHMSLVIGSSAFLQLSIYLYHPSSFRAGCTSKCPYTNTVFLEASFPRVPSRTFGRGLSGHLARFVEPHPPVLFQSPGSLVYMQSILPCDQSLLAFLGKLKRTEFPQRF